MGVRAVSRFDGLGRNPWCVNGGGVSRLAISVFGTKTSFGWMSEEVNLDKMRSCYC